MSYICRSCASYSPSGTQALVSNFGGLLELYDTTREPRTRIPTFGNSVRTLAGHLNNKYSINSEMVTDGERNFIISGSEDKQVCIWSENGSMRSLPGHEDVVLSVSYEAVSKCLVSGGTDGSLGVWRDIDLGADVSSSLATDAEVSCSSDVAIVGDMIDGES